ncbi:hypothetical protein SGLAM104S_08316 [Streptomyces glaucescens]
MKSTSGLAERRAVQPRLWAVAQVEVRRRRRCRRRLENGAAAELAPWKWRGRVPAVRQTASRPVWATSYAAWLGAGDRPGVLRLAMCVGDGARSMNRRFPTFCTSVRTRRAHGSVRARPAGTTLLRPPFDQQLCARAGPRTGLSGPRLRTGCGDGRAPVHVAARAPTGPAGEETTRWKADLPTGEVPPGRRQQDTVRGHGGRAASAGARQPRSCACATVGMTADTVMAARTAAELDHTQRLHAWTLGIGRRSELVQPQVATDMRH